MTATPVESELGADELRRQRAAKGKGPGGPPPYVDVVDQSLLQASGEVNLTTHDGQRFALRYIPNHPEHGLVLNHEDRKWGAYLRGLTNVWQLQQGVNGAHIIIPPSEQDHMDGARGVIMGVSEAPDAKNALRARVLYGDREDWNIIQAAPTLGGSVAYILAAAPSARPEDSRTPGRPDPRGHLMLNHAQSESDYSIQLPLTMEGQLRGVACDARGRTYVLDSKGEMWAADLASRPESAPVQPRLIDPPSAEDHHVERENVVAWRRVDLPLDVTFEKLETLNTKFVLATGKNATGESEQWMLGHHGWRRYDPNEPAVLEQVWGPVAEKGRKNHVFLGPFARLREGWASGDQPAYIKALPKAQRYLAETGQLASRQVSAAYTRASQAARHAAQDTANGLPEPARYLANRGIDGSGHVMDAALKTAAQVAPLALKFYGARALATVAMKQVLKGANPAWLTLPPLAGWLWKQRHALRAPADPITMPGGPTRHAQTRMESAKGYFKRHLTTPTNVGKHFADIRGWLAMSEGMKAGDNDIRSAAQPPASFDGHEMLRDSLVPFITGNITSSLNAILKELAKNDSDNRKAPLKPSGQANMPGAYPLEEDVPRPAPFLQNVPSKAERFREARPVEDASNVLHQLAEQADALMGGSGVPEAEAAVRKLREAVAERLVFKAGSTGNDDLEAFCAIHLKKIAHDLAIGFDTVRRVNERVGQAGAVATSEEPTRVAFRERTREIAEGLLDDGLDKICFSGDPNFEAKRYTTLSKLQADHHPEAAVQYLREVVSQLKSLPPANVRAILSKVVDERDEQVFQDFMDDVSRDAMLATRRLLQHLGLDDEWKRFDDGNRMLGQPSVEARYQRFLNPDKTRVYSDDNLLHLVLARQLNTLHGGLTVQQPPPAAPGEPGHELSGEHLPDRYEEFDTSTKQLDFMLRRGIMIDATFSPGGFFNPQNDLGLLVGNLLSDQLLLERLAKDVQEKKALAAEALRLGGEVVDGLSTLPQIARRMHFDARMSNSMALAPARANQLPLEDQRIQYQSATAGQASEVLSRVAAAGSTVEKELHKIDEALKAFNAWSDRGVSRAEDWKALARKYGELKHQNPIGEMFKRGLVDMTVYRLMSAANRMHNIHSHPDSQMMAAARLNGVIAPEDMDEYGDHMARLMPIGAKVAYKVETHWGADGDGTGVSVRAWSREFHGARERPDQPATADTLNIPLNRGPNLQPLYYFGKTKGNKVEVERTKNGFNISIDDFSSADIKAPGIGLGKFMWGAGRYIRNFVQLLDARGNPEVDDRGTPRPPSLTALLLDYFGIEGVPGLGKVVPSSNGGITFEVEEDETGRAHHLASKVIACKLTPTELLETAVCLKEVQRNGLKLEAEVALQYLQAAVAIMTPNPRDLDGRFKGVVGALLQAMLRGSVSWSAEKESGPDEVHAKALKLRDALVECGLDLNTIDVSEIQASRQWAGVSPVGKQSTEAGRADAARNPHLDPNKAAIGDFVEFEWKVPTGILVEINNVFAESWKKPEVKLDRKGQATSITMNPRVWKDFDEKNFPSLEELQRVSPVDHERLTTGVRLAMKAGVALNISQELKPAALAKYNAAATEAVKSSIVNDKSNYRLTNVSAERVREFQDVMFTGFGWLRYKTGGTATYTEPAAMLQYPLVWPDEPTSGAASTDSSKVISKLVRSAPQGLFTETMGDAGFDELTARLQYKPELENAITNLRTPDRLLLTLLDPERTTEALANRARTNVEDSSRQDANADHFAVRQGVVSLRTRDPRNASAWIEAPLTPDQLARLLQAPPSHSASEPGSGAASTDMSPAGARTPPSSPRASTGATPPGSTGSTSSTERSEATGETRRSRESYEDEIHVRLRNERNAQIANRDWAQDILRLMSSGSAQATPLGADPARVLGDQLDEVRERAAAPSVAPAVTGGFNRPLHVGGILHEIEGSPARSYPLDSAQRHVMHTFFPHASQDYDTALVASMDPTDRAIFSEAVDRVAGRVEGAIMARVVVPSRGREARPTEAGVTHGTQLGGISGGV